MSAFNGDAESVATEFAQLSMMSPDTTNHFKEYQADQNSSKRRRERNSFDNFPYEIREMIYTYVLHFPRVIHVSCSPIKQHPAAINPQPSIFLPTENASSSPLSPILLRISADSRRWALKHYSLVSVPQPSWISPPKKKAKKPSVPSYAYLHPETDVFVLHLSRSGPGDGFRRGSSSYFICPQVQTLLLPFSTSKMLSGSPTALCVQQTFTNVKMLSLLLHSEDACEKASDIKETGDLQVLPDDLHHKWSVEAFELYYRGNPTRRTDFLTVRDVGQDVVRPYGWGNVEREIVRRVAKPTTSIRTGKETTQRILFTDLPYELRDMIWKHALEMAPPRVVNIHPTLFSFNEEGSDLTSRSQPNAYATIPALLHVNSEARALALKAYQLSYVEDSLDAPFYFDASKDTIAFLFTNAATLEKRNSIPDAPPSLLQTPQPVNPHTLLFPLSTLQRIRLSGGAGPDVIIAWLTPYFPSLQTVIVLLDQDSSTAETCYDGAEFVDAFWVQVARRFKWDHYSQFVRRGWIVDWLFRKLRRAWSDDERVKGELGMRIVKVKGEMTMRYDSSTMPEASS